MTGPELKAVNTIIENLEVVVNAINVGEIIVEKAPANVQPDEE